MNVLINACSHYTCCAGRETYIKETFYVIQQDLSDKVQLNEGALKESEQSQGFYWENQPPSFEMTHTYLTIYCIRCSSVKGGKSLKGEAGVAEGRCKH